MKATPKEFITLRFYASENTYNVRSVPVLQRVTLCGIDGFSVHRQYLRYDQEKPTKGMFRVSHIETGASIADAPTIPEVIAAAEAKCEKNGAGKGIRKQVREYRKWLKTKTPAKRKANA